MKHVGIVGVSAEGAALCYKTILQQGDVEITLHQSPFHTIVKAQLRGDWDEVTRLLQLSLDRLKDCDFVVIPANSVHFVVDKLKGNVLSILDIVKEECKKYAKVGVLGVGMTMRDGLFDGCVKESVIPSEKDMELIDDLIYSVIVPGKATGETTQKVLGVIHRLKNKGCDAVILGCTELPLVITNENSPIPVIDTTRLLAKKAFERARRE